MKKGFLKRIGDLCRSKFEIGTDAFVIGDVFGVNWV